MAEHGRLPMAKHPSAHRSRHSAADPDVMPKDTRRKNTAASHGRLGCSISKQSINKKGRRLCSDALLLQLISLKANSLRSSSLFRTRRGFRVIEKSVEMHLFAHRLRNRFCGGCSASGTDLLRGCAVLVNGCCRRSRHGRFSMGENTLHLADVQRLLNLGRRDRGSSLYQGGRGKQSSKNQIRFHEWS